MQYGMDSADAIHKNPLGEEDRGTENGTNAAFSVPFVGLTGFPVDILLRDDIVTKYKALLCLEHWN